MAALKEIMMRKAQELSKNVFHKNGSHTSRKLPVSLPLQAFKNSPADYGLLKKLSQQKSKIPEALQIGRSLLLYSLLQNLDPKNMENVKMLTVHTKSDHLNNKNIMEDVKKVTERPKSDVLKIKHIMEKVTELPKSAVLKDSKIMEDVKTLTERLKSDVLENKNIMEDVKKVTERPKSDVLKDSKIIEDVKTLTERLKSDVLEDPKTMENVKKLTEHYKSDDVLNDLKNMGDVKKPTNHPKSDILKDLKHIKYVKKSHKKLVKDPVKHHKYSLSKNLSEALNASKNLFKQLSLASEAHRNVLSDPLFKYTMRLPECKRLIIILTGIAVLPCKRFKLSIVQGKISPLIFDFRWKNKLPSFNQGTKKLTFHCADTFQIILTTSPQSNKVSVDGQIKKIFTNRHPVLGGRLKIIGDIEIMSVEIK
ncbi:uncharacterized protein LOC118765250 [Octopus sinensis]|uniref:Uncharacterized protein LOC118765250 n=1 Tax=Octopus sinensis TaxID=2607531 RepID=A0A7E6F541_9MOLL|nr:uncharacterized protein LOC118765250 [Octopus sinensis]